MQWNFSSVKKVISFWNPLFQKNIERWDCKRYVLFVDSSYSENDFLKISAFSHMNVDNKWPFWAGFHKVMYKQQGIILRLTKLFSNLALIIFRKCSKWNDQFEMQNKMMLVVTTFLRFLLFPIWMLIMNDLFEQGFIKLYISSRE